MRFTLIIAALTPSLAAAQSVNTQCYRFGQVVSCTTAQQPPALQNYLDAMGGVKNLASPFTAMEEGVQAGQRERYNAEAIEAQQLAVEAKREQLEASQIQADQATQERADVQAALDRPTAMAFSNLMLKYPDHASAFKQAWDMLNKK
jgi:hypothetical protein